MKRKLIVRLKGGLGNQLFCYAAARRIALKSNADLVIDHVTGFQYDLMYQRSYALGRFKISAPKATPAERMEPFGRLRRLLSKRLSQLQPLHIRRYIEQIGIEFQPELLDLQLQEGTTYFDGFGQSERYFDDISDVIRHDLQMEPSNDSANQQIFHVIGDCNSVAVHMRWFDFGPPENSSNMSLDFYRQALDRMRHEIAKPHFFIFSDNPAQTRKLFGPLLRDTAHTIVEHNQNAEADFWLMRHCRHFIIGNSTFAWWAAWLGEKTDGTTVVIAPARSVDPTNSVTAWGFPYLLPERWIVL